jgi:AAA family ATP:ADP antiporter
MLSGSYILRLVSWRVAATINPIIIGITGLLFFAFTLFKDHLYLAIAFLSLSPLSFTISIGLVQNVLSKSTKYAFFDATKEMAYIPLDNDLKSRGKAAADVIGGRLGKAGGSLILWSLLMLPNTTTESITPIVFSIFIAIIIIWFFSIKSLSKEFYKKHPNIKKNRSIKKSKN